MFIILLLLIAIAPSIILGLIFCKLDFFEKEPPQMLIKLFLLGILATVFALIFELIFENIFPVLFSDNNFINILIYSIFGIALFEEGSKFLFTYIFTWKSKYFNHIYDSIIYCVFTSLGFATVENILYVLSSGVNTGLLRAVISVPGHIFFSVFMGYYMGLAKLNQINNRNKHCIMYKVLALVIPILIHGLFNYCLLINNSIMILIFLLLIIFLYISSFKRAIRFSKVRTIFNNDYNENSLNNTTHYCVVCGRIICNQFCENCKGKEGIIDEKNKK